jgi:hypothetical protein
MPDDLSGRRFGAWTVLAPAPADAPSGSRYRHWMCRCTNDGCGATHRVRETHLVYGRSTQCKTCHNRQLHRTNAERDRTALIGVTAGPWTVREVSRVAHGCLYWLCTCTCGATRILPTYALRTGRVPRCPTPGCTP